MRRRDGLPIVLAIAMISLAAAGCAGISCHRGDQRCEQVRFNLERTRHAAEWRRCGTPVILSRRSLEDMGPAIAPYLVDALSDPEPEVAEQAAMVLETIGHLDDLLRWCADDPTGAALSPSGIQCTPRGQHVSDIRPARLE